MRPDLLALFGWEDPNNVCQDLTGEKSISAFWIAQPCGAPSSKRVEQPPRALSCAKDSLGSRMEAEPRAEAASHPNTLFDWTQQTRHHCCVPAQLKVWRLACVHPLNVLCSNLSLPWSPAPKASLSKMIWRKVEKLFLSRAWAF